MSTTVLIIDDRRDNRDTLKTELSHPRFEEFKVIGELPSGEGLRNYFNELGHPDIVFLDKRFEGKWTEGAAIAENIKQLAPETKIIMVTEFDNKLDFQEIHSTGLLDGYIRKENVLNYRKLMSTLYGAINFSPQWDVPADWLKYRLEDNPQILKNRYANENNIDINSIDDHDRAFQDFLMDEYKRQESGGEDQKPLTRKEWEVFKSIAMGYSKKETEKQVDTTAYDALVGKIRGKLGISDRNKCNFLIKAIEMEIPEVIDKIEGLTGCRITFSAE